MDLNTIMPPSKRLREAIPYTVGWIAALPQELAAAIAVLDEEHKSPENFKKHAGDKNIYTWGAIAGYYVVMASLPMGRYGTISAATTVLHMVSSLPHLRFGLMVGIGAGIPRAQNREIMGEFDIRLGDVVVSQPTGTSPGVVQYDLGKVKAGGQFERVGSLNSPHEVLLRGMTTWAKS